MMFRGPVPCILWLYILVGAVDHQVAVKVTPVQKVIQLLEDMIAKGTAEKQAEEIQFVAYTQFCQVTSEAKKAAIKKSSEMIETLEADIAKYEADADDLAREIAGLDVDIDAWEGDTKSTTRVREIENKEYEKTRSSFTDSIDALNTAKADIEAQSGKVEQATPAPGEAPPEEAAAEAFLQIQKSKLIPAHTKKSRCCILCHVVFQIGVSSTSS